MNPRQSLVKSAYQAAIGAGWLSPSEFWKLHPEEFWWLYEAKAPKRERQNDVNYAKLYRMMTEA